MNDYCTKTRATTRLALSSQAVNERPGSCIGSIQWRSNCHVCFAVIPQILAWSFTHGYYFLVAVAVEQKQHESRHLETRRRLRSLEIKVGNALY